MSQHQSQVIRVLHQSHSIDQYHPSAELNILWPCMRFSISLQAKPDQELNLFESTLLRLLCEGERDLAKIGQQMGLMRENGVPSGLIEFLSLKLQQLGLIDSRLKDTDVGREALEKIKHTQLQVIGATVYFDLLNKRWLPIINRGELQPTHVECLSDGTAEFHQGTPGRAKQIKATPLFYDADFASAPDEREVIDIISRSRQRNKKLNLINNDDFVARTGTISVNNDSELVYLHCKAFMTAGGRSVYVSDGFRSSIQEQFTHGFNNGFLRKKNPSLYSAFEEICKKSRRKHQRYFLQPPRSLEILYKSLTEKKVTNANERSEYEMNVSSFISQSYAEIERILAKCYSFSKLKNAVSELSTEPNINVQSAVSIAADSGFLVKPNKLVNTLLRVKKGSIKHLKVDMPVMSPLIFCHLLAARDDPKQPMARLAKQYPELLRDIARLMRWRNPVDHGDKSEIRDLITAEEVEFVNGLVVRVRSILAEWIGDMDNKLPEHANPDWLKEDIRKEVSYRLEKDFGLMCSRMNKSVYEGLFDALVQKDQVDARSRVNALSGALQHALYQASQSLDAEDAGSIDDTKQQLSRLGAEQIVNSNVHKVQAALKGVNATLGANFLAFWMQITRQQQQEISRFVKAVDSLNKLRGHSGQILDQDNHFSDIEKEIFKLIKHLMEQYCG